MEQMEDALTQMHGCAARLAELREMLVASGHVRQPVSRVKARKEAPSQPMKFLSSDGIEIEVGKNALQNERLDDGRAWQLKRGCMRRKCRDRMC